MEGSANSDHTATTNTTDRRSSHFWLLGLGTILGFNLLLGGLLAWGPLGPDRLALLDNLAQASGPLAIFFVGLALLPAWRAYFWPGATRRHAPFGQRAPFLLALGSAIWALGQLGQALGVLWWGHASPFGQWIDLGYLGAYPLLLVGILGLPRQPLRLATRLRLALDGLLIAITFATYSWYLSLGPTLLRGVAPLDNTTLAAAYPLCILALLVCLRWIELRADSRALTAGKRLLSAGLATIIATDATFQFLMLRGGHASTILVDVGWTLGYMLIGLSSIVMQCALNRDDERARHQGEQGQAPPRIDPQPPIWRLLLPYLSLPFVGALLIHAWHTAAVDFLVRGVLIATVALLIVVIIHQVVVIAEGWQYAHDLGSVYRATLEQVAQIDRLQHLATTDPLTGLHNRRALNAALDDALTRCAAHDVSCAVMLLDLDRFKALNDTYGHLVGDAALRDLAHLLTARQRGDIRIGRWGGEEFLVLVPLADELAALDLAETLRAAVAAHICNEAGGIRFTCSVGVAVFPQDATDREALIAAADRAMYTAKCLGRNQVFSAADPAVTTLMAEAGVATSRGEEALAGTVEALAALVKVRDRYSGHQVDETARLAVRVALALGEEVTMAHQIGIAARLHDVGKVTVPDAVLHKPGALTDEEWQSLRQHPANGAAIVGRVPGLRFLVPLIRGHHERWDGDGYPDNLSGAAIPLGARIIAATEAYGALTADRPYRAGRPPAEALAELRRCAGSQFDPQVVAALEHVLAQAPTTADRQQPPARRPLQQTG